MTEGIKHLYHYTTMSGLKGIVENGCIHATNVRYLNDSQEFYFGLDYLKNIISPTDTDFQAKNIYLSEDASLLDHLIMLRIEYILSCFRNDVFRSSDYFVASFSSKPDILSQWRAYGKENMGYSIKFDFTRLHYPSSPMPILIHKIEYVDPTDSIFAQEFIEKIVEHIKSEQRSWLFQVMPWLEQNDREEYKRMLLRMSELDDSYGDLVTESLIGEIAAFPQKVDMNDVDPAWYTAICSLDFWYIAPEITNVALTWKHCSFSEEDEYRIVYKLDQSLVTQLNLGPKKFKEGKTFLIPYIEIPYDFRNIEVIQEVVVGPCPHPNEATNSVHQFLNQNISKNFNVVNSKIPYRFL